MGGADSWPPAGSPCCVSSLLVPGTGSAGASCSVLPPGSRNCKNLLRYLAFFLGGSLSAVWMAACHVRLLMVHFAKTYTN